MKTKEKWKDIKGWEGLYKISTYGNILNIRSNNILSQRVNSSGYPHRLLCNKKFKKNYLLHRLVALHFIPNLCNKPQVNHKDGNKLNSHVSNLEWVTPSENCQHSHYNGLQIPAVGEKAHRSKLSKIQALEIIKLSSCGFSGVYIANIYNVTPSTICALLKGRTWSHLDRSILV